MTPEEILLQAIFDELELQHAQNDQIISHLANQTNNLITIGSNQSNQVEWLGHAIGQHLSVIVGMAIGGMIIALIMHFYNSASSH